MSYAASPIKAIARYNGTVTATSGSSAANVTITAVDLSKTMFSPSNATGGEATNIGTMQLTSTTNVELKYMGTGSGYNQTIVYDFQVLEFF